MKQRLLMIGTKKGAFLAFAGIDRKHWELRGPFFKGLETHAVTYSPWPQPTIICATKSAWWGPDLRTSTDFGATWREPLGAVKFNEDRGRSVEKIWTVKVDLRARP